MKKHIGNLIIEKDDKRDFTQLVEVSGSVYVQEGATFTAPALVEVSGYVDVRQGATFTAPALTKSGSVDVQEGATFTAPALVEVSGSVYVQEGATFTAPALTKSGYVYVRQGATFTAPALVEVSGYVDVRQGATFTAPALTKSGYIYVQEGATFTAPALTKSGSVDVRQGATFTAPALTKSGYVDVQEGATFTAPALVEVSGSVDVRQGATLNIKFLKGINWKAVDGNLFIITSEKTSKGIKIYSGYNANGVKKGKLIPQEIIYVAEKENFFAHGKTVKKAIDDLDFKIISEKLKNDPIKEDTLLTVNYYRLITGSCDIGVREFMKRNSLEYEVLDAGTDNEKTKEINPIKAIDLLPILEKSNAYGLEKFRKLITF